MAYTDNKIGDVGKSVDVINVALVAPMVLQASLSDTAHMINQSSLSGKEKGAMVVVVDSLTAPTTFELKAAEGGAPDDAWVSVGGAASYTLPAATASVLGGVKMSAATADQAATTVSGADVAALVTSTNTALASIVAKINAILAAERTAGQKVT